ncbi:hypothetical protein Dimus_013869, partial [Dionaea muscipula]
MTWGTLFFSQEARLGMSNLLQMWGRVDVSAIHVVHGEGWVCDYGHEWGRDLKDDNVHQEEDGLVLDLNSVNGGRMSPDKMRQCISL